MNFRFENIFRHLKSTFFGLLVIAGCFAVVWLKKASFAEVAPVLLAAIPLLLYGKEPQETKPN